MENTIFDLQDGYVHRCFIAFLLQDNAKELKEASNILKIDFKNIYPLVLEIHGKLIDNKVDLEYWSREECRDIVLKVKNRSSGWVSLKDGTTIHKTQNIKAEAICEASIPKKNMDRLVFLKWLEKCDIGTVEIKKAP